MYKYKIEIYNERRHLVCWLWYKDAQLCHHVEGGNDKRNNPLKKLFKCVRNYITQCYSNQTYKTAWLGTTSTFSNSSSLHASLGESKHKSLSKSIPGPWRFFRVDRRTGVRYNVLLRCTSGVAHECLWVVVCKYEEKCWLCTVTV